MYIYVSLSTLHSPFTTLTERYFSCKTLPWQGICGITVMSSMRHVLCNKQSVCYFNQVSWSKFCASQSNGFIGWKIIMFVESGLEGSIVILNWSTVALRDRKIQLFWIHNSQFRFRKIFAIQFKVQFNNLLRAPIQLRIQFNLLSQHSIQTPALHLNSIQIQFSTS